MLVGNCMLSLENGYGVEVVEGHVAIEGHLTVSNMKILGNAEVFKLFNVTIAIVKIPLPTVKVLNLVKMETRPKSDRYVIALA